MNHVAVCLQAAQMLRQLQWDAGMRCQSCRNVVDAGHEPDCALADLLDALDATEGTAAKVQRKEQQQ